MAPSNFLFSSESVSEGHPDKMADQISDAVLDECLKTDKTARVACETLVKGNVAILAGEITTTAKPNFEKLVRDVAREIGYNDASTGFDHSSCKIEVFITQQSPDISQGVNEGEGLFTEQGAGDQGIMFGYACNETPELMPLPISLAHKLVQETAKLRKQGRVNFLQPDAKSQVSVEYINGQPKAVRTVVLSTQHTEDVSLETLSDCIINEVIKKVIPANLLAPNCKFLVNPTGRFVIGGPLGDCGVTGRKIIVDTYGGYARHGGGAFSGKDPTKVDRSAAYAARHLAKNIVAAGLADKCEVQVAYAIGVAEPVSIYLDTFGTGKVPEGKIAACIPDFFDLRPKAIIHRLAMYNPIYRSASNYGHFGREATPDGKFTWEKLDKVKELREALL